MATFDRKASPLVLNLAHLLAACLFYVAMIPSGPIFAGPSSVGLVAAICFLLAALAWGGNQAAFRLEFDASQINLSDAGILLGLSAILGGVSWPFLQAELWSDAVYHASLSAKIPQLLMLKAEVTQPQLWIKLSSLKAAHLVQLVSLVVVFWLVLLFLLVPHILSKRPLVLGGVWIAAVLLTRTLLSTDAGLLADTESLPVLLAEPGARDQHPPLRLLPLTVVSAFLGASPFSYRFATFAALLIVMAGYYFAFKSRAGSTLAALGALAIASLPGLLQTASVVEASVWTALSGWIVFAGLAGADRADRPLNLVPFAIAAALAALMRAPGFIVMLPLIVLAALELSRRPFERVELLGLIAIAATGFSATIAFIVFGTPAISEAPALQQLYTALIDGAPAVALVTVIGLPPLLMIGFVASARDTQGYLLTAAVIGYLVLSVAVFYGPTKSVLWGIPRYQSEIAVPLIAAGVTTFVLSAGRVRGAPLFRGRTFLPAGAERFVQLAPLACVVGANLFAVVNVYNTKVSYLQHTMPRQSVAADAPFAFKAAFEIARLASPGKPPYHIGIWYGGFGAILSGGTAQDFSNFSRLNSRHRFGWIVNLDTLAEDQEIGSIVVEPEMDSGATEYFTALGWERQDVVHPVSSNTLIVFKRPRGPTGTMRLLGPMPAPPESIALLIGTPVQTLLTSPRQDCRSFVDGVLVRYGAPRPGVRLGGWGWLPPNGQPFDLVVAADGAGIIVGANDVATERPDVAAAFPQLTQSGVGFELDVPVDADFITLLGVDRASGTACEIVDNYALRNAEIPK